MYRRNANTRSDARHFSRSAEKTRRINVDAYIPRGGIRL